MVSISAWLAAMNGQITDSLAAVRSLGKTPAWLYPGLVMALRTTEQLDSLVSLLSQDIAPSKLSAAELDDFFGALLSLRGEVSPEWLARTSGLLRQFTGVEPKPYRRYREFVPFVQGGQDRRSLRTLHPEMREAVEFSAAVL
jgi:hypothetical protein